MQTKAQLKAKDKYRKEKTKAVSLTFYPADMDLYEHLQTVGAKQTYIKDLIRKDMGKKDMNKKQPTIKIFGKELPSDCVKAIKDLKKLKVYMIMNDDTIENFSDVWFRVQHECDMYDEGEDSNELSFQSYTGAMNWLDKYEDLYYKYNN